jgi:two-component system LytT family response regulator
MHQNDLSAPSIARMETSLGRGLGGSPASIPPLRVVVVDDEPLARAAMVQLLGERTDVVVEATCASGAEAVAVIPRINPDIVFLDIRMPGLDGFQVVQRLAQSRLPYVVFVTAFDRYAIEAFRVRALDYLLKPVHTSRLEEALCRAREQLRLHSAANWAAALQVLARNPSLEGPALPSQSRWRRELLVRTGLRDVVVKVDDVDWIEADTYYARLHVGGRTHLLRERMHVLAAQLDPQCFVRIHRSAIVNLGRIREIRHNRRGDHVVVLSTGAQLKAARQRWAEFKERMHQRGQPPSASIDAARVGPHP